MTYRALRYDPTDIVINYFNGTLFPRYCEYRDGSKMVDCLFEKTSDIESGKYWNWIGKETSFCD